MKTMAPTRPLLASQLVSAIRREAADTATLATGCGPG